MANSPATEQPVAWLKESKDGRQRVDLYPDLDAWMVAHSWSVTPLYRASAGRAEADLAIAEHIYQMIERQGNAGGSNPQAGENDRLIGLLRGCSSLLIRSLRHGLLREETKAMVADIDAAFKVIALEHLVPTSADVAVEALRELVACKDLKERIKKLDDPLNWKDPPELTALSEEYGRRQPEAWKAARAVLAGSTVSTVAGETQGSPLAWLVFTDNDPSGFDYMVFASESEADSFACGRDIEADQIVPLYRRSATAGVTGIHDKRDAERYRIARLVGDWSHNMKKATTPEAFDAAVDSKERL